MDTNRSPWSDPLVRWLLGFFGTVFGILLLPRTVKFLIRRVLLGTLTEVVTIVLAGLLTEKAVGLLRDDEPRRDDLSRSRP